MIEELDVLMNPKSRVAEAVKTIRTNLEFSSADSENKKIMLKAFDARIKSMKGHRFSKKEDEIYTDSVNVGRVIMAPGIFIFFV